MYKPPTKDDMINHINSVWKALQDSITEIGKPKIIVNDPAGAIFYGMDPAYNFGNWDGTKDQSLQALEWCDYLGQRCQVLSKNFQDGTAQLGCRDATGPYTLIVKLADIVIENPRNGNKCSCGMSSLRESEQGNHADYCDKYYNPWKG